MYSRLAVSYSSLETARQPSRKGGCCAFTDEGVKAVRSAPKSKKKKKTALRSDLRDLPISSLPGRSAGQAVLSLNKNWLFGVKGTNGLLLSVAVCSSTALRPLTDLALSVLDRQEKELYHTYYLL